MQSSTVIKILHRTLTLVLLLLLLVICFGLYHYSLSKPYDDRLYASKQLNDDTWLYITQYQGGNAIVSNVFRYYLWEKIQKTPLKTWVT